MLRDHLSPEVQARVDEMLNQWSASIVSAGGPVPSGRAVTDKRRELEIQFVPLSEIVREMVKIGDPDSVQNRKPARDEFDVLARELNRREQLYLKSK